MLILVENLAYNLSEKLAQRSAFKKKLALMLRFVKL